MVVVVVVACRICDIVLFMKSGLKQVTPADFTIRIDGLPKRLPGDAHKQYQKLLKAHIEKVVNHYRSDDDAAIVDVALIRDYQGGMFSAKEQAIVQHQLNYYRVINTNN